jgi:hypothetical protein
MPAKKRSIYKTVVSITVLSDEPINGASLEDIFYETKDGQWVGYNLTHKETKLKGLAAVQAISDAGSAPEFFYMDSEGYPTDDYEEYLNGGEN